MPPDCADSGVQQRPERGDVRDRDLVRHGRLDGRLALLRVRMVRVGGRLQRPDAGEVLALARGRGGAGVLRAVGGHARDLAQERHRPDAVARPALGRAQRRRLAEQDRVGAVAGERQALVAGVVELAVQRRRRRNAVLPLRRQPAGLVGLVPQRPQAHARQHLADAVLVAIAARVAPADGLDEGAIARRIGPVGAGVRALARRRDAVRVARAGTGDREVHAHAEVRRGLDEVVEAIPVARRVRARIGRLEAPALRACAVAQLVGLQPLDLPVGELRALADDAPQDRHADGLGAERAGGHERARHRPVAAVEELVVVHDDRDLIGRGLRRGSGEEGQATAWRAGAF